MKKSNETAGGTGAASLQPLTWQWRLLRHTGSPRARSNDNFVLDDDDGCGCEDEELVHPGEYINRNLHLRSGKWRANLYSSTGPLSIPISI
ncbi:hypothetical protein QLX08_001996 [Tetragonisca angustula]|uniref:Uncharacterized protein n=1 Tax=Tetragonisca angustula TaxID=166442 RepID=A0AAW1AFV4_9HYME